MDKYKNIFWRAVWGAFGKVAAAALFIFSCAQAQAQVIVGGSVFGGGNEAPVGRGTTVLIDKADAVITGSVYGGGAKAKVDTIRKVTPPATPSNVTDDDSILVTILAGTIRENVYGGGLGEAGIPANVYGPVHVRIGQKSGSGVIGEGVFYNASNEGVGMVFGANNVNGTPMDSILVDIYKTARVSGEGGNSCPAIESIDDLKDNDDQKYALKAVYGGGNLASYTPWANKVTTVNIHTCDNTIEEVYGGGNAADVGTPSVNANTFLNIHGGRIKNVFGGGNGYSLTGNHDNPSGANYNPGANIYGTATTTVYGGYINQLFGGSNSYGNITTVALSLANETSSCGEYIESLFGGANESDISSDVSLTIACGSGNFDEVYGGSNMANITGNVTLTVRGGEIGEVYGGSKGTTLTAANISGNVTLNLEGGTIGSAFGGSNINGNIGGTITVNVLDLEATSCGLNLDYLYGGCNATGYTPGVMAYDPEDADVDTTTVSPVVNLYKGTVNKAVFGGSLGATADVYASPRVHFNPSTGTLDALTPAPDTYTAGAWTSSIVTVGDGTDEGDSYGNVYGGGNAAPVHGTTTVLVDGGDIKNNIYGAGKGSAANFTCDAAMVWGNTSVTLNNGRVRGTVYGGGELGRVQKNTVVTIGTAVTDQPEIMGDVFGAGAGVTTHGYSALVRGDVTVAIAGNARVRQNVYGGGELASVGQYNVATTPELATAHGVDQYEPYEIAAGGTTTVTIAGNAEVGPAATMSMRKAGGPDDYGHVFGGGKGMLPYQDERPKRMIDGNTWDYFYTYSSDPDADPPVFNSTTEEAYFKFIKTLGLTGNTYVTVGGTALVKGSVYGGAENGRIMHSTHVTIADNCQIGEGCVETVDGAPVGDGRYSDELWTSAINWDGSGSPDWLSSFHECSAWRFIERRPFVYDQYADPKTAVDPHGIALYVRNKNGEFRGLTTFDGENFNHVYNESVPATAAARLSASLPGCDAFGNLLFFDDSITGFPHYLREGVDHEVKTPEQFAADYYDSRGGASKGANGATFYGNVFGGGCGFYPYAQGKWMQTAGQVEDSTFVNITGGHILTSVYGGNELTDVKGTCTVNMVGGTLGVPRSTDAIRAHPVTCYLFGAGKGDQRDLFNTWTNVEGNTFVNVTGTARIFGSTFGGGEDGHVYGNATTNIGGEVTIGGVTYTNGQKDGVDIEGCPEAGVVIGSTGCSSADGNIFGGGRGFTAMSYTAGVVQGNINVNVYGGHMLGTIYGGGRLASVGTHLVAPSVTDKYGKMMPDDGTVTHGYVTITMTDGTIGATDVVGGVRKLRTSTNSIGDIYGGGLGTMTAQNTIYNYGLVKQTRIAISGGTVWNNVYGGGRMGIVTDSTYVRLTGGTVKNTVFGAGRGVATDTTTARVRGNVSVVVLGDSVLGSVYGGGELASVGNYIADGTTGIPASCTRGGACKVVVDDDVVIGRDGMRMPEVCGNVFGAGMGNHPASSSTADLAFIETATFVDATEVTIGGTALVRGSVYGGSERGHVLHNTHVTIKGNCQIGEGFDPAKAADPSTYPGYNGDGRYTADNWTAAKAWNGSEATASSISLFHECDHWHYDPAHNGESYDIYADAHGAIDVTNTHFGTPYFIKKGGKYYKRTDVGGKPVYTTEVTFPIEAADRASYGDKINADGNPYFYVDSSSSDNVKYYYYIAGYRNTGDPNDYYDSRGGNSVAGDGRTFYGNVFGGGSGYFPYAPGKWLATAGQVYGSTTVDILGGHVLTSVYGGNEMTDVKGNATVNMVGGTIGVPRTDAVAFAHPVTCYLFGAGKGDPRTYFNTMTDVANAYVNVTGTARIFGSTFGGGEDGHVDGNAVTIIGGSVTIGDDTYTHDDVVIGSTGTSGVDGNVFGGGRGYSALALTIGLVKGNCETRILDGTIYGSVYGGGRTASVGTHQVLADDDNYGVMLDCGWGTGETPNDDTHTTFFDETAHNHGHVAVDISGGTIGRIDPSRTGMLAESPLVDDDDYPDFKQPSIGDVFGGGKGLALHDNPALSAKYGWVKNTIVRIHGSAQVNGSVYGGGEISSVGNPSELTPSYDASTGLTDYKTGFSYVSVYENATIGTAQNSFTEHGKGYVYGSGKGKAGSHYSNGAYVKNTVVTIGAVTKDSVASPLTVAPAVTVTTGYPRIYGSVFGGGEDGHVRKDARVYVRSGTIGSPLLYNADDALNELWFDPTTGASKAIVYRGNVYAGGRGIDQDEDEDDEGVIFSPSAGQVYGNALVRMTGGHVYHNIYGSGAMASVGTVTPANEYVDGTWTASTGRVWVDITGGTVGDDSDPEVVARKHKDYEGDDSTIYHPGRNNGRVFGAGRGLAGNVNTEAAQMEFVHSAKVTIGGDAQVLGAVFGGGENGHVRYDTRVDIGGDCVIGAPLLYDECEVTESGAKGNAFRGNVFGGGRGVDASGESDEHRSFTAGRVYGNTEVNVSGGRIYRAVYGGGMLANVGNPQPKRRQTAGTETPDDPDDDEFEIVRNDAGTPEDLTDDYIEIDSWPFDPEHPNGVATVNITGGYIGNVKANDTPLDGAGTTYGLPGRNNGAVFGSGAGFMAATGAAGQYSELAYVYRSYVNISSESTDYPTHIRAAVFGGGENGHVWDNATVNISGGTIGNAPDGSNGGDFAFAGNVFGSGRGMNVEIPDDDDIVSTTAGWVKGNTTVNIWKDGDKPAPVICRDVYGGGNLGSVGNPTETSGSGEGYDKFGFTTGLATVNILGGDIYGDVYGGSRGKASSQIAYHNMSYVKNTMVTITGSATIHHDLHDDNGEYGGNVYGGGNAGHTRRNTEVVVGGAKSITVNKNLTTSTPVSVTASGAGNVGGTVGGTLFGAGRGSEVSPTAGQVNHSVKVDIKAKGHVVGDVYGGGALARSNHHDDDHGSEHTVITETPRTTCAEACTTAVTVYDLATIGGSVYGGGMGQKEGTPVAAHVEGDVFVTINKGATIGTPRAGTTFQTADDRDADGNVFGGNNLNGAPKGNITVSVIGPATTSEAETLPMNLNNVFGGGNQADLVATSLPTVSISGCGTNVNRAFGGGNAAAVTSTAVTINGGTYNYVFGGGNGEVTAANVGYLSDGETVIGAGTTSVTINGGTIGNLFGGSNSQGTVRGASTVAIPGGNETCPPDIDDIFGGGNNVAGGGGTINLTDCHAVYHNFYAGANNANINGSITLNVYGGTFDNLFGGNNAGGVISGDVLVNVYGGNINKLFGGSNKNGNILGSITVNVDLAAPAEGCPALKLDTVYGGGQDASYTPTTATITSPQVNIINDEITYNVYGGGLGTTAIVTANPQVTIGSTNGSKRVHILENVYGGGSAAEVVGNTAVTVQAVQTGTPNTSVGGSTAGYDRDLGTALKGNVFGGGFGPTAAVSKRTGAESTTGNTSVDIRGLVTIFGSVYGGGNAGKVAGNTNVKIGDYEVTPDPDPEP